MKSIVLTGIILFGLWIIKSRYEGYVSSCTPGRLTIYFKDGSVREYPSSGVFSNGDMVENDYRRFNMVDIEKYKYDFGSDLVYKKWGFYSAFGYKLFGTSYPRVTFGKRNDWGQKDFVTYPTAFNGWELPNTRR